jgi:MFS family permease
MPGPGPSAPPEATGNPRLAALLAMAMFVLVVHDLGTTVSGVQSVIALEALVSAAFILIGSKVGDLIGRKRAHALGLLGDAAGAQEVQDEIIRINTDARPRALQVALLIPLLAGLIGFLNSFRMMRLPDPAPSDSVEKLALG